MADNALTGTPSSGGRLPKEGQASMAQQNKQKLDTLTQAKDRAQLTATTAMSVVHVALLRNLLVTGTPHARFYTVNLVLIGCALALQVLAGSISLVISHMRSNYASYDSAPFRDLLSNMCCCCRIHRRSREQDEAQRKPRREADQPTFVPHAVSVGSMPPLGVPSNNSPDTSTTCCPCFSSSATYHEMAPHELDRYDRWCATQLELDLQAAEARWRLEYLTHTISEARLKLSRLETNPNALDFDVQARTEEVRTLLARAKQQRERYEDVMLAWRVSLAHGTILYDHIRDIREYQLLAMTSRWQQVLNCIFYIVFVLNAFITGFGIVGTGEKQGMTYNCPSVLNDTEITTI